jgi:RNA polymerase sigma-70 factor, ECF subfamily
MLARRVCRRDPLPRRPRKFSGRGPKLALAGGVRNLKGAKRTSEGERASAGRGCSERGTLNASTVETLIWSYRLSALLGLRGGDKAAQKISTKKIEPKATLVRHIRQMVNECKDGVQFEWLALRRQTGDSEAFADLIAVMERPLLYYATGLTGNQDAALDVLQDVWLRVFHGIRKLKEPSSLKPWLYAITHGVAVDRVRKQYKRDKADQSQLDDVLNDDEPAFDERDATAVHDALSRLGVKHREVLVLHFLQDLSILEIANVVGCSEGTVKSRIHYAKRQMKQILEGVKHGTANK